MCVGSNVANQGLSQISQQQGIPDAVGMRINGGPTQPISTPMKMFYMSAMSQVNSGKLKPKMQVPSESVLYNPSSFQGGPALTNNAVANSHNSWRGSQGSVVRR